MSDNQDYYRSGGSGRGFQSGRGHNVHQGGGSGRGHGEQFGGNRGPLPRRGGDGGRGRTGRVPDLSGIQKVKTNILQADLFANFDFYRYSVDVKDRKGRNIDSRSRRRSLFNTAIFNTLMKGYKTEDRKNLSRLVFFQGSSILSARPIPELDGDLPFQILAGTTTEGDTFTIVQRFHFGRPEEFEERYQESKGDQIEMDCKCNECPRVFADGNSLIMHCQTTGHSPAYRMDNEKNLVPPRSVFLEYVNVVLAQALLETDLAKWGRDFIDPASMVVKRDRRTGRELATIYKAYKCEFNITRPKGPTKSFLTLTVDLRAKVMRGRSLLQEVYPGGILGQTQLSEAQQSAEREKWIGNIVIYKGDYKCYSVVDLRFDCSADTLPVTGLNMTHARYFLERKNIRLNFPNARPMVQVLGRRNESIFFPAELVFGEELDAQVKDQLPLIASFRPEQRNTVVDEIMHKLTILDNAADAPGETILDRLNQPGIEKGKAAGLLASCGICFARDKADPKKARVINAKAVLMPIPKLIALGVEVPKNLKHFWVSQLRPHSRHALYNTDAVDSVIWLNPVVVYSSTIDQGSVWDVYSRIRSFVNAFGSKFRLADKPVMERVDVANHSKNTHCEKVSNCLSSQLRELENIFVLDLIRPGGKYDPDYHPVKQMLAGYGVLSQFVSYKSHDHGRKRDGKSNMILQGVARQILQKMGVRLWWVTLPPTLPLPAVLVGIDIYHSPRKYNPEKKKREARPSCAAIVVQVVREKYSESKLVEIYSETVPRPAGEEFGLGHELTRTVSNALKALKVDPQSCFVWRDGISESSFETLASREIEGIRRGLQPELKAEKPLAAIPSAAIAEKPLAKVPLSYIICQKRIATKFLTFEVDGHKNYNGMYAAPSGTFVDGFQGPKYYTYYIQGRAPDNSTAKPVRYTVLQRDKELSKKEIPELTWAMCHDYPNWAGPIKVPSLCQSAHKLAMLAGGMDNYQGELNHRRLSSTMHFL